MWLGNTAELLRCMDNTMKQYQAVSMMFDTANLEWVREESCNTYGEFGKELKSSPRQAMDIFLSYDFEEDGDLITFQPIEGHTVSIPRGDIIGFSFERPLQRNRPEAVRQVVNFEQHDVGVDIYNAFLSRRVLTFTPREFTYLYRSK
ncbi:hypothetical protein [Vibrio phage vB_VmeM-Yong XC32]|nr:hypothetical protein [Vibrio phage vB_VmeM-Yong XC31]QAX96429.1 hypothetical protein [Vibrio phage vB_VmeM-Yong XC32]QAX96746.1 hypothetical protein [Vibrio phage vB_VmeM-Yong MS31]QAX97065.1 hypothetical protein [Vibrio phage vB_VmeM-Yong MS32]